MLAAGLGHLLSGSSARAFGIDGCGSAPGGPRSVPQWGFSDMALSCGSDQFAVSLSQKNRRLAGRVVLRWRARHPLSRRKRGGLLGRVLINAVGGDVRFWG
jgi:hypothetical protein